MQPYKHQYMIGTEYGGGRGQTLKYSCPQGMTEDDLKKLFPTESEMDKFCRYMRGQTMSLCNGRQYHHNRIHDEHCTAPITEAYQKAFPDAYQHTQDSPFDWRCGYDGGYEEDSECKDNPHGVVTYPWDVERYLRGLPVID